MYVYSSIGLLEYMYRVSAPLINAPPLPLTTQLPNTGSLRSAFKQVYQTQGMRGFFVGFSPCVLRAFPANAAAFLGFEMAMRALPE